MKDNGQLLRQYTSEVDAVIERYLPEETGLQKTILEAANYSMRAGGKRLRPLLMRETYRLFGGMGEEIEPFMAAIEMIHTASLIHDDLPCMDNDELRRGRPATWVRYGYDMAVLAGDALLIYAVETAAKALPLAVHPELPGRAMGLLAHKTGIYGMIGGQTADVELTGRTLTASELDFIYRLKTGALLEAAMMIGSLLAGAKEEEIQTVERMASAIGMAFQIQDDILDITGSRELLGKPVMSDKKNQKETYASLHGLSKAGMEVKTMSERAIEYLRELPGTNPFLEFLILMLINRVN